MELFILIGILGILVIDVRQQKIMNGLQENNLKLVKLLLEEEDNS